MTKLIVATDDDGDEDDDDDGVMWLALFVLLALLAWICTPSHRPRPIKACHHCAAVIKSLLGVSVETMDATIACSPGMPFSVLLAACRFRVDAFYGYDI